MNGAPGRTDRPDAVRRDTGAAQPYGAFLTKLQRGVSTLGPSIADDEFFGPRAAGEPIPAASAGAGVPGWIESLLRIPLPAKLVGANVLLLVAATTTALVVRHRELSAAPVLTVVIIAFVAALLLNTGLVMLAVRPLRVLERTVDTIWHGDLGARVPVSLLADRHVTRVARMFNILLDGLVSDRARMRRLATEVISTADSERAALSRELHDSAAQSLAALVMQLSVAVRDVDDAPREVLRERMEAARTLATNTLEEVRLLAHTTHPRVLDDLGLIAALKRLARDITEHAANYTGSAPHEAVTVDVVARDGGDVAIPAPVASVLYRVAQEAVQNARRHADARHIEIRLRTVAECATIEIVDDGRGFDPDAARASRAGIGLFTMRERVALVDGDFSISGRAGGGTSVTAAVPLGGASHSRASGFQS